MTEISHAAQSYLVNRFDIDRVALRSRRENAIEDELAEHYYLDRIRYGQGYANITQLGRAYARSLIDSGLMPTFDWGDMPIYQVEFLKNFIIGMTEPLIKPFITDPLRDKGVVYYFDSTDSRYVGPYIYRTIDCGRHSSRIVAR